MTRTNKARCKSMVSYLRVSTKQQGDSGLGLEAQRSTVARQAEAAGCTLIAEYVEVESGKRSDRPELAKALAHAKRAKATLVFAKLDRLARNARFLMGIIESGADVVFCDMPNIPAGASGKFVLGMMAQVAELEAGVISERTRDALAAYKARGGLLGGSRPECRNLDAKARQKGSEAASKARIEAAVNAYADLLPFALEGRKAGKTLATIAAELNTAGHTTRTGSAWSAVQVMRMLKRAGE